MTLTVTSGAEHLHQPHCYITEYYSRIEHNFIKVKKYLYVRFHTRVYFGEVMEKALL